MAKKVGIHIALHETITEVAEKARALKLPIFQTFAITSAKQPFILTAHDKKTFLSLRKHFETIFLHTSYWINCARNKSNAERLLEREASIAEQLEIPSLIMHPGAIAPRQSRQEGIELVAKHINTILSRYPTISILLENPAHGNRSIGGNIQELSLIMENIQYPERVGFCIDTAHAFVYGYNLAHEHERNIFFDKLETYNMLDHIKLIHLNDTLKPCRSKLDVHTTPGQGLIGTKALQSFIAHPTLQHVPLIIEMPKLEDSQEIHIVKTITKW